MDVDGDLRPALTVRLTVPAGRAPNPVSRPPHGAASQTAEPPIPLVGRFGELAALSSLVTAAGAGDGGAAFVVGEPGIGKSRLVAEAAVLAAGLGVRVLRGRATRAGVAPLRPFAEALLGLARAGWTPPRELGPYLPILGQLVPDWRTGDTTAAVVPALLHGEAILRVLKAAHHSGVLLILEDLHDAGPDTIAVLEYLVDNSAGQPIALVGTLRDGSSPALDLAEYSCRRDPLALLTLPRLDDEEVAGLCAELLGSEPELVPGALVSALARDSAGNPLIVTELLRDQIDNGDLVRRAGRWEPVRPGRVRVPRSLARDVAGRLRGCDPATHKVLHAAAVLGEEFPTDLLGAAAQVGVLDLPTALESAMREQFLVPAAQPGWLALRHPMIGQVLRDQLAPSVRTALTRQAAAAVEQRIPDTAADWTLRAATLYEAAGDDDRAGKLFARAGRTALSDGSPSLAVDLLLRARRCHGPAGHPEHRADLLEGLVRALGAAGRHREALDLAAEVDDGRLPTQTVAALHLEIARVAMRACWAARARSHVQAARAALADRPAGASATSRASPASAGLRAEVDMMESGVLALLGPEHVKAAEDLALRAIAQARAADLPAVECEAHLALGRCRRDSGSEDTLEALRRAERIARIHNLPELRLEALLEIGANEWMWHGEPAGLAAAGAAARARGAVIETRHVELCQAVDALFRGRFDEAEALLTTVWDDLTRLRLTGLGSYARAVKALIEAHRGNEAGLAAALAEFDAWRGERDDEVPLAHVLAQGIAALVRGDPSAAREHFGALPGWEEEQTSRYRMCGQYGLGLLVEITHGAAGWGEYEAVRSRPAAAMPWNAQFLWLARAVLAGRDGDVPAAQAAQAEFQRISEGFPPAHHLGLDLVATSAARDGWGEPVRWLREAEAYYADRDIPVASRFCRSALRDLGEPIRQRRRGSREVPQRLWNFGVTVREYEILRKVAKRRTNREIAADLFLSHRTVERHIANLLAKTGAGNRRDLGMLISDGDDPFEKSGAGERRNP